MTHTSAFLPNGHQVDVPTDDVHDWQLEVQNLETFLGLAAWYINKDETRAAETEPTRLTSGLPLSREAALEEADAQGFVTVVVAVDQADYMDALVVGSQSEGADDQYDLLHSLAFEDGITNDCSVKTVAVDGSAFIVEYTTNVNAFSSDSED